MLYTGARHAVVNAAVSLLYVFLIGFVNRRCARMYTYQILHRDGDATASIRRREVTKIVCVEFTVCFRKIPHFEETALAESAFHSAIRDIF